VIIPKKNMDKKQDIHNYKRRLENTLSKINSSKIISKENKNTLLEYYQSLVLEGISIPKIERYLYDIKRLSEEQKKELRKLDEKDLKKIVTDLENRDWSASTKQTFKIGLRKFYKFVEGVPEKGVSPERLKWMKTTIKKSESKLPEDLINEKEVEKMILQTSNIRDKALIASLYESGCRIGEICSIKIKNVVFDDFGARIQVTGKTGPRVVRLVTSSPYLLSWINVHPTGNREDFVWLGRNNKLLCDTRISYLLKACAKKAGIKKRIHPHGFRHARATKLASHLTESQMKSVLGWTQGSDMAAIYVHLSGRDSEDAILKMNGIAIKKEEEIIELSPKKCIRCQTSNEVTNKYCKCCGFVLDKEEAEKIIKAELEKKAVEEFMNKIVQNKEILEMIKEIKLD